MRLSILSVALGFVLTLDSAVGAQTNDPAAPQKEQKRAAEVAAQQKQAKEEQKTYLFEMNNKKWDVVLEWLADQTGRPFISNIRPKGSINFKAKPSEKYTIPQIMDIINDALLPQKMILLNRGSSFTIVPTDEKARSLEDLLAQALKNNPDIRVAESKVREAEAKLNRVRMQVSQRLAILNAEMAGAKLIYDEAVTKLKTAERMLQAKSISMEEYRSAVLTRDKLKTDLARLEAELPYLLGSGAGVSEVVVGPDGKRYTPMNPMKIYLDNEMAEAQLNLGWPDKMNESFGW